ncbi:MAG: hypothetical protein NTZ05_13295, partial [Chloroflexi bacterium]|nr:hypothetical protein [Chloroflexota bacterium]
EAVQQALAVSPPVAAHMEWQQEKLRIVPEPKLDPDTTYTISVASQAPGAIPGPFSLQVRTAPQESGERPRTPADPASNSPAMVQAAPNAALATSTGDVAASARPSATITLASDAMQPAACTFTMANALARLTRERPEQAARLGCATGAEVQTPFHEQTFEAGMLLRREDAGRVYMLQAQPRRWRALNDDAQAVKDPARTQEPADKADWSGVAPGTLRIVTVTPTAAASLPTEPAAVFLSVWRLNPDVRTVIGGPAGRSRRGAAVIQEFEQGIVLVNDRGGLYALNRDATWTYLAEQLDVARASRNTAP